MTKPPSTGVAVVAIAPASEPASGSVVANASNRSPRRIGSR